MREIFEKLPEIAGLLKENPDIKFEDERYIYYGLNTATALVTTFVSGAWWIYQERQKVINDLNAQLMAWKGKSISAMLHGTCSCGEPWHGIVSDREGFNLLHCFNCGKNKYENQEYFGSYTNHNSK